MVCLKTPLFLGLATALVTPFAGDRIDFAALERLLEYQYLGGAAAVLAAGTTGEAPTLSAAEWEDLVSFCCRKAGGRTILQIGCVDGDFCFRPIINDEKEFNDEWGNRLKYEKIDRK